ncbi:MAG: N-acetylmuramoyl-L-alanine amidase [Oscillospiraceae bacterium]|nr:N-acetylmuramoyl-L-alanine amidase [Oscillospiraceae bacterium]
MKKLVSLIFAVLLAFALSAAAFAAEEPPRFIFVSPNDGFSAEEAFSHVSGTYENAFGGTVLDLRGADSIDFYSDYLRCQSDAPHEIIVFADEELLPDLPSGTKVMVENGISEEAFSSLLQKHGSDNLSFYLPFEDENALSSAEYYYGKGFFKTIFTENLLSCNSEYGYEEYLTDIATKFENANIVSVNDLGKVLVPSVKGDFYSDIFELNNQYLVNKLHGFGFCLSDLNDLVENKGGRASFLADYFNSEVLDQYADFSISQKLDITRPTGSSLKVSTESYTIFGTSNPDKPLYMNGEEITRISENGTFAVTVKVPKKGKTFSFTQGGKTVSVTLSRTGGSTGNVSTTKVLSSIQPAAETAVKNGETTVTLSCVGPSGGSVSAEIGGKKVKLEQAAYADNGVPATFKGTIDLSGEYPENEITAIGRVTYTLRYNGNVKNYTSEGSYYFIGENAAFAVRASVNLAGVEAEDFKNGNYITTLRTGCADYVTETTESGWYKLSMGGYINPAQCGIITGNTDITAKIGSPDFLIGDSYEKITFKSENIPAFKGKQHEKALSLTLYNTEYSNISSTNPASNLARRIVAVDNGDGSITLNFYATEKIWGWDFFTDPENGSFSVVIKPQPKLSDDTAKPLSGIRIALCSGHGGIDPGALSIAGEEGVNEAQINLANMMAINQSLESLGAETILLYTTEGKLETYGRMDPAREAFCDVYVCCHANSIPESSDANLYCGSIVYYHYDISADFSQKLVDYISSVTKRDNERSRQDYYNVTRFTLCPSVMLEVGYVSNPADLESLINKRDIQKTAYAVTKAILEICDN